MQNLELEASVGETLTLSPVLPSSGSISIDELAKELDLNYEATRKRLRRAGYMGSLEEIPIEVADSVGSQKLEVRSRKLETKRKDADKTVEPVVVAPEPVEVVEETKVESEARPVLFARTWFLYLVYLAALVWQVWHTAAVLVEADTEKGWTAWVSGLLFALSVQFTALLMTIRGGSVWYLRGFAVVEFLFNCAYYEPYRDGASWSDIIVELLISAAIAFTIYSYSELFAQNQGA